MRLPPGPLDAVGLVGSGRVVPGDQWIEQRAKPGPWVGAPWESIWWAEALRRLHEQLWSQALAPGPVIARTIIYNEALRDVTLYVETWGRGVAGAEWGLPLEVLTVLDGLAGCPAGGDLLALPAALVVP